MKTSVEAVSGAEKRLRVEVPADEVSKKIEEGFAEVRRMVPIRGFRKGKAPMEMVRRLFREHVEAEVAESLVKESISGAVKENNLRILSMPKIDGAKVAEGKEFAFTATFEVAPEVDPVGYKGLPAVRDKVVVTDAEVEEALSRLRESFAEYHAVEGRGSAVPDLVDVTLSAAAGEEKIAAGESASFPLGSGYPLGKEVEEQLTGVAAGDEKKFEISFPEDSPNRKYAGKKVAFSIRVAAVREKRLPDLDDEFVKNFGDMASLDDLKGKLKERLVKEAEDGARHRAEEEVRKGLLERNAFDVPRSLVDRQVIRMVEDTANRLVSQGVDLKKMDLNFEKMRERFAPAAERTVRISLLLEAIAGKEGIDVAFSEIEAEMKSIAEGARMDYEKVRELYGDEERMDALRAGLIERKTMDFLMSNAEVKEGAPE